MSEFFNTRLGVAVEFIKNGTTATQLKFKSSKAVTRIETIAEGEVNLGKVGFVGDTEDIERYKLITGDILFSHINSIKHIGKTAIIRGSEEIYNGMNLLQIRPNVRETNPSFLHALLRSDDFRAEVRRRAKQAVNQASISIAQLQELEICLPPLPEQKKIAEILSGIDKTLEITKRQTATLEALEIATRNELFENLAKESHSERKLSEIALAPITYGIVQPGDYDPNGIILVRGQDYLQGWGKKEFFKVSPKLSDKYKRSLIQPKDVLICIAGANTGDSSITPKWISNANITQTTARVRADTNIISPEFLLEFTKSRVGRERLMNYVRGSAQPGLNLSDIEKIIIPIPGNDQQQQISNSMDSLKKLILSSRKKEDYLKQIKKGLSSDLLSGRKRVSI